MNAPTLPLHGSHRTSLILALALAVGSAPARAQEMDHSEMSMPPATTEAPAAKPTPEQDTPAKPMDHSAMEHEMPMPSDQPLQPVPPVTEADRVAAFPAVAGHAAHDN